MLTFGCVVFLFIGIMINCRQCMCVCLGSTCSQAQHETESIESDVPAPPKNAAAGGKASLQPERTPVLAKEIEAILFYTYI